MHAPIMSELANETVKLNTGFTMPVLGLGVYQAEAGRETQQAVRQALEVRRLFIS